MAVDSDAGDSGVDGRDDIGASTVEDDWWNGWSGVWMVGA